MKVRLIFSIVGFYLLPSLVGCATYQNVSSYRNSIPPQIFYVQPSSLLPLETGSSPEAVIGKCIKAIDSQGFAQYGECAGDFNSYYSAITVLEGDLHDKGLFQIDAGLDLIKQHVPGGAYYSEYKIEKQYSNQTKKNHTISELNTLRQSCNACAAAPEYIIETAYSGCSVTEYIKNLKEFNLKYIDTIFRSGELKKGVKIIGRPIHFEAANYRKNAPSCQTPEVIAVGVRFINNICADINVHRVTELEKEVDSLQVKIVNLYNGNNTLTEKISYYEKGTKELRDKVNVYENNIRILNKNIVRRNFSSEPLLTQIETSKDRLQKLDNKLAREYKKSTSLVMKSLNEATNYEQKIISMETEKRILEDNVAVLSSKLHEKNKQIDSANLKLDFNRELLRNYEKNPGLIKNTKEKVNAPRKDSNGKQASKL